MMPLLVVIIGVILLLLLITVARFNAFLAFVIVCIFVGVTMGLSLDETIEALKKGIGDTLSLLVLILGFGAMLGQIINHSTDIGIGQVADHVKGLVEAAR